MLAVIDEQDRRQAIGLHEAIQLGHRVLTAIAVVDHDELVVAQHREPAIVWRAADEAVHRLTLAHAADDIGTYRPAALLAYDDPAARARGLEEPDRSGRTDC